jgi:type I restriction enzyme S subunit
MGSSPDGKSVTENPEGGIEFHQGKSNFGNDILNHSGVYTTKPTKTASPNSIVMSVRAPVGDSNITERKIAIGRGLCAMGGKEGLSTKFLYYFINANIQLFKNRSKGTVFESISINDIKQILIPLPPLPVQGEIVRILDKFSKATTELIATLTKEIELRRKQYEYYRKSLLNFKTLDRRF